MRHDLTLHVVFPLIYPHPSLALSSHPTASDWLTVTRPDNDDFPPRGGRRNRCKQASWGGSGTINFNSTGDKLVNCTSSAAFLHALFWWSAPLKGAGLQIFFSAASRVFICIRWPFRATLPAGGGIGEGRFNCCNMVRSELERGRIDPLRSNWFYWILRGDCVNYFIFIVCSFFELLMIKDYFLKIFFCMQIIIFLTYFSTDDMINT